MANLLSWIGNQASRIEKQVNPFDNGATYSNPNPRPTPPPQYNTGGLTVNNAPNTQQISVRPSPAPVSPPRPILFNNAPNTQQINVPKFTGPGTYSWNKPAPYQLPQLGTPGHGINLGHWFGSSLFENALNAPEQIKNVVQAKQAGLINNEQAIGGVGNALLNSAGMAIPAGKVEQIAKMSAPAIKDVITQGVKTGAKLGAGFGAAGGALNSMQQGGNAGQVIKSAAINAPIGAVTGAALGGAVPVVAKGVHLTAKTAPKVAEAVKPQIPPELLQERNKWVGTYSNAKDPAIKNFADRKITQIDNQIALAREGGFAKIPGSGAVGKNVGGDTYYHTTTPENAQAIRQGGYKAITGPRSQSAAINSKGVFLYKNDMGAAQEFGKNFKQGSEIIPNKVEGKVYNSRSQTKSIRSLAEDQKYINDLKAKGYVGVQGDEMGQPVTFIFDTKAIKPEGAAGKNVNKPKAPSISKMTYEDVANRKAQLGQQAKASPDVTKFLKNNKTEIDALNAHERKLIDSESYRRPVTVDEALGVVKPNVPEVPTNYRSAHQITDSTPIHQAPIDNMVAQVKGKYGLTNFDRNDIAKLQKLATNPEADVKIYRVAPKNELNHGDWVTTDKTYAGDIKRQNGGQIHQFTVKAKELHLPNNIEDNPSLARFSAFKYQKDVTPPTPVPEVAFKYKSETGNGTVKYNKLTPQNSFQDINGVAHPLQSNASIAVKNLDGTGETRIFKVNNISSQKHFNNQLLKYGKRGDISAVNIDESPALNKSTQGVRVSSSAKVPSAGRYPSQSPKVSPDSAAPLSTPKSARPEQPGLRNGAKTPVVRQEPPLPVSAEPQSVSSPNNTPKRGFVQSVNRSPEVSPTVAKRTSGTYTPRNTAKLAASADKFASGNMSNAVERVSKALSAKDGHITDKNVADAIAVAKRLDSNKNHAQATDIYERLAEHLTAQGQSVQAASLLDRRTPEGLRYQIVKTFKKAGVTPSKELNDAIDAKIGEIKTTKSGTPERILATKQLQKMVADNLPSNVSDKAISFWKAGLLTGMRTQSGNLLSNETFSLLHNASNPLAAGLDKLISLKTGERTKTLSGRGLISGTGEGVKRGATYLKTGIDERSTLTNKFDSRQVNFKNKALNTYVNGVFKLMGAADRPHYYRQLRNSLNDLAIADGKNRGLTGQALRDHVNNFVKDPPQQAFQTATNEAEKAVLANDTILSKAIANLRSTAENAESPLGKAVTEAAINLLMPFTKVPSAFISRVVDYTPVGAVKTIAGQISRKQFDQRALVTAISEATTGTGLMYLGYKLAQNNMLSGDYPNDPKEQQRWKAEGIQPNSIKIGGQWINMNYAGPLGLLFGMGGRISDSKNQGGSWMSQQAQAYGGLPKSLTQQSFLQGLSGAMQAINEPGRYLNNYEKSQAGSVIPTLVGDVATATDKLQRQSNTPLDSIKARVPGLRETLNPAQDVYGNQLDRKTGALSTMVNPLRPTTDTSNRNPVIAEVNRLHNVDPNNSDLQVTPTQVNKTIKVEGNPVHLNNQQRYDLQKTVGQTVQSNWSKLIQTPEYKAMSDLEKAKALSNLRTDSTTLAEREYFTKTALATYQKPATASVQRLANGDLSKYLGLSTSKSTKSSIKTARVSRAKSSSRRSSGSSASNSAALAKFKADMKQKPLKIVGALPAPSKSIPKFSVPTLKTVYQKPSVNTKPTVGFKKSKRA